MTGYLLDTSVLSAFAPERKAGSQELSIWIAAQGDAQTLYLSAITVAEVEKGIRKLHRTGGFARAERLSDWLDSLLSVFGDRILAIDPHVGRAAGAMEDAAIARGRHPGLADVLIAATADVHGLVLLTANGKHFEPLGIAYLNPFEALPGA